jgi:hypothetical protein
MVSAVRRGEFVSDRVSYIVLRGPGVISLFWICMYQVSKKWWFKREFHMKIILDGFNTKVGRENIFKPTIGSESLHQAKMLHGHWNCFVYSFPFKLKCAYTGGVRNIHFGYFLSGMQCCINPHILRQHCGLSQKNVFSAALLWKPQTHKHSLAAEWLKCVLLQFCCCCFCGCWNIAL